MLALKRNCLQTTSRSGFAFGAFLELMSWLFLVKRLQFFHHMIMTGKSNTMRFQIKISTVKNLLLLYFYLEANGIITYLQISRIWKHQCTSQLLLLLRKIFCLCHRNQSKKYISEFDYELWSSYIWILFYFNKSVYKKQTINCVTDTFDSAKIKGGIYK